MCFKSWNFVISFILLTLNFVNKGLWGERGDPGDKGEDGERAYGKKGPPVNFVYLSSYL